MDRFVILPINFLLITSHRHSEEVVRVLGSAGLPIKGSAEYYSAQAAFDQHRHRQLTAPTRHLPTLTFAGGDVTKNIPRLGSLHYALVYVGTLPLQFLVALSFTTSRGEIVNLNSYEPGSSSTSEVLLCNNSYCSEPCPLHATPTPCPYEVNYMSENTLTRGILVKDVMHIETYDNNNNKVGVFGCGEVETGCFLGGGALNGLLGLGSSQGLCETHSPCVSHPMGMVELPLETKVTPTKGLHHWTVHA